MLWAEWDLVEALFAQVGKLFPETRFGSLRISDLSDKNER
jgi:hypothetical protein